MNEARTKALLVEDNPADARLIKEILTEVNGTGGFDLYRCNRLSDAIEHLAAINTDVVLLDLSLPDSHGLDTVARLHTATQQVPVVVLTGMDDEMLAIKAVQEGAQDYLVKGQFDGNLLVHSIRYAVERHRLRMELEETRQQQLEIKDRFISRVSHELRTPLAAIYQFVTILLDGLAGKLNPEQREYLEITLRNTDQLRTMVADLLEGTRAQTNQLKINPQYVSLTKLITETLKTIETASGKIASLLSELPGDLPPVHADPDRVRQILVNLINNAIQFTPANGTITVRAEIYKEDPNYICISVADTGSGINAEEQELIFEYLYQGENNVNPSRRGLGLGLNICKELVSRQEGKIWVESEIGQGSTFYFTLPIFSLKCLLAPILTETNLQKGSIALISIEASPIEKRKLTKNDEIAIQEAWSVTHRCIPVEFAALLPAISQLPLRKVFFVIAFADQHDTEALFLQIQQHLAQCEHLNNVGLDPITSFTTLDVPPIEKMENVSQPDRLIEDVLNSIEDQIKIELDKRRDT